MFSRILSTSLVLILASASLHAQSSTIDILNKAQDGYHARGIGWTAGGAASIVLGVGLGVPLLVRAGGACEGVSGECYAGLADALGGLALLTFFTPMGGLFLTKGLYSFHQEGVFDDLAKKNPAQLGRLLKEEADSARLWRYIGGGTAATIGYGAVLTALIIEATQSDDFSGGAVGGTAFWFSPFMIMGTVTLLTESLSEKAYDEYKSSRRAKYDFGFDVAPTQDGGMYAGLRLKF